jgi:aldehyde dehydrogenase (NAD+)
MAGRSTDARVAGKHLIAGRWSAGDDFASTNPADRDEVVGVFPAGTSATAGEAVAAARAAYPAWRRTSRIRRAELFDNLAQLVKRDTDDLARLMAR